MKVVSNKPVNHTHVSSKANHTRHSTTKSADHFHNVINQASERFSSKTDKVSKTDKPATDLLSAITNTVSDDHQILAMFSNDNMATANSYVPQAEEVEEETNLPEVDIKKDSDSSDKYKTKANEADTSKADPAKTDSAQDNLKNTELKSDSETKLSQATAEYMRNAMNQASEQSASKADKSSADLLTAQSNAIKDDNQVVAKSSNENVVVQTQEMNKETDQLNADDKKYPIQADEYKIQSEEMDSKKVDYSKTKTDAAQDDVKKAEFKNDTEVKLPQPPVTNKLDELSIIKKPEKEQNKVYSSKLDQNITQTITNEAKDFTQKQVPIHQDMPKEPQITIQDAQPSKYIDTFSQLSNVVNSHTTVDSSSNAQLSTDNTKFAQTSFTQALRNMQPTDYQLHLDLTPTAKDALMKESYDAKIRIYPPELGAVTAKMKVSKDGTDLLIMTENARVKEIVEANLSQLREKFQQADINLTNIEVRESKPETGDKNNSNQQDQQDNVSKQRPEELLVSNLSTNNESPRKNNSLVDTYA